MNLRQAAARIIELTEEMRAVEATAVKHGETLKTHTEATGYGFSRVDKDIAEIWDWRKLTDEDLDTSHERLDLRTADLQTQINRCQTKRPWVDMFVLAACVPMWSLGMILLVEWLINWLTK